WMKQWHSDKRRGTFRSKTITAKPHRRTVSEGRINPDTLSKGKGVNPRSPPRDTEDPSNPADPSHGSGGSGGGGGGSGDGGEPSGGGGGLFGGDPGGPYRGDGGGGPPGNGGPGNIGNNNPNGNLKLPKPEKFDGKKPKVAEWVFNLDLYFNATRCRRDEKIP